MNRLGDKVKRRQKRNQSLGEEIGNAITHGAGAVFAIVAIILMLLKAQGWVSYISVIIYGIGFLVLYVMSCLYHAFKNGSTVKKVFRYFDHSSIFLLIGGTYAPILLVSIGGTLGLVYFILQWVIIAIGITLKCTLHSKSTKIQTVIFLILGWSGISVLPQLYAISPMFLWLIIFGGLAYSIGVGFYASRFKYSHFIWHFFVLTGALIQWFGIYLYLF